MFFWYVDQRQKNSAVAESLRLKVLITQQRFAVAEMKCLLRQLLLGLAHLHAMWIVHRDLKTSNILLDRR